MKRKEFKLRGAPVTPRPWARRVRALNPQGSVPSPEALQIARDLPSVVARMVALGHQVTAVDMGRAALTRLQRELRDSTEADVNVASDPTVQHFRKTLHLLLDH